MKGYTQSPGVVFPPGCSAAGCWQGGPFKYQTPRPLEESEIPGIIEAYVTAAKNAVAAGFDGVEVSGTDVWACCPGDSVLLVLSAHF